MPAIQEQHFVENQMLSHSHKIINLKTLLKKIELKKLVAK
jgi:hypothetical protein